MSTLSADEMSSGDKEVSVTRGKHTKYIYSTIPDEDSIFIIECSNNTILEKNENVDVPIHEKAGKVLPLSKTTTLSLCCLFDKIDQTSTTPTMIATITYKCVSIKKEASTNRFNIQKRRKIR